MNILNIAWYTFLRNLRDVKSLLNMILLPVILILILGNALASAFHVGDVGKTKTAYLDNDRGAISGEFEKFLDMDEIKGILEVTRVETYEEGRRLVSEGKVSAFIVIEDGFTANAHSGSKSTIKVYKDKNNTFRASIVDNIVEGFTDGANTMLAMSAIGGGMDGIERKAVIERIPLSAKGKIPSAMDYYGVTMLVLITMYGSLYSLHGVFEDYLEGMRNRLLSAPVRLSSHFAGKIVGTVFTIYIQILALILFTKVAYGVNWGDNTGQILFIAFTLSFFAVTMGLMIAMLLKQKNIANAAAMTVIPVMTFVSGGYVRIVSDSKFYTIIKSIMPSSLGHTAFFNSIYGEFAGQTVSSLAILWGMILVMGIVSVIAGRRRLN
jgi:ABC-2 type transport system permease protein